MRQTTNKDIKLFLSFILIISVCFAILTPFAHAAKNGNCGDNIKWSFSAGTLNISGSGEMKNYNEVENAPWGDFASEINAIFISDGITSIGSFAFYNCSSVKAINIPDSVHKINDKAFYNCTSLRLADLSENLVYIGKSAFYNCEQLEAIYLPDSVETISDKAFYLCRSIKSIIVPQNVKNLGKQAFAYCESLLRVEINTPIASIPEWCFYGCEKLTQIKLPETVTKIGTYAFKRCDNLYTISHPGNKETLNSIRQQVSLDVPNFENSGFISYGSMENSTQTSEVQTDESGNFVSQTNTTVKSDKNVTLITEVKKEYDPQGNGKYTVYIIMTVDGDKNWNEAIITIRSALSTINDSYSIDGKIEKIKLTLYLKNTSSVSKDFLKELSGRKMLVEIMNSDGSLWCFDCSTQSADEVTKDVGINYVVSEATTKTSEKLGTDNCYQITFGESSQINANVVIKLPDSVANTNAFLYEKGIFGKLNRLQASVVDENSNAYFYLSSINKNTEYIIGINVPDESINDIIIPEEASDPFGAIARLEKIEYVSSGPRTLAGLTFGTIILIVLGILLVISITVGAIMCKKNRINIKRIKIKR